MSLSTARDTRVVESNLPNQRAKFSTIISEKLTCPACHRFWNYKFTTTLWRHRNLCVIIIIVIKSRFLCWWDIY